MIMTDLLHKEIRKVLDELKKNRKNRTHRNDGFIVYWYFCGITQVQNRSN